jgi:hypothetical protein
MFSLQNTSTPQLKKSHVQQKSPVLVTGDLVGDAETGDLVGLEVTGKRVGLNVGPFVGGTRHLGQPLHFAHEHFLLQSAS